MTAIGWLFFGMAICIGFYLGRRYQRWQDKELKKLAKQIVEEAQKREAAKATGL